MPRAMEISPRSLIWNFSCNFRLAVSITRRLLPRMHEEVIDVQGDDDDRVVVVAETDTRVGLKGFEPKLNQLRVDRVPIQRALR